jgi:hypothetical protein
MDMNVIYVGLDVDDTQYHGSALNKKTGLAHLSILLTAILFKTNR